MMLPSTPETPDVSANERAGGALFPSGNFLGFQAGLIQSAFYIGYFLLAMPAALLMRKLGYKAGFRKWPGGGADGRRRSPRR